MHIHTVASPPSLSPLPLPPHSPSLSSGSHFLPSVVAMAECPLQSPPSLLSPPSFPLHLPPPTHTHSLSHLLFGHIVVANSFLELGSCCSKRHICLSHSYTHTHKQPSFFLGCVFSFYFLLLCVHTQWYGVRRFSCEKQPTANEHTHCHRTHPLPDG